MGDEARWSALERIFHGALAIAPEQRSAYIRTACGSDDELRRRVESLLLRIESPSVIETAVLPQESGPRIGPYQILTKLGAGGMGEVYLAIDSRLGRNVALKVLRREFAADPERKRRFEREARAASALNHPNIVTVYEFNSEGKLDYLAMEYVPGKPLDRLIPHDGLKLKEALHYAVQVASALACAHDAGIVHRDLKPANVLITDNRVVKLTDFGLAKQVAAGPQAPTLTQDGLIVGTVAYMSPEQAEGKPVDMRSDIFSFGSMLYEMVTGRRAFHRDTTASTLAAVLRDEPQPANAVASDVPQGLAKVIERCLHKSAVDRYGGMDELKAALESAEREAQTPIPSPAIAPATAWPRLLWTAALAAALVLAAVAFWRLNRNVPEPVLTPVPLTTYPGFESSPTFSPDEQQVAFSWCEREDAPPWMNEYPNVCNIYVKQIGVEPPSRLTSAGVRDFSPRWSPDGKWIAFLRMSSPKKLALLLIPQRGGRERIVQEFDLHHSEAGGMPPGPYLAWTPDSRFLACTVPGRHDWGISLIGIDSGETRVLTELQIGRSGGAFGDTAPAISPDGRTLVFSRHEAGYELYRLRLSDQYAAQGEPVKISTEGSANLGAAWLPDESAVVFSSNWFGENGLWLASGATGTRPRRLPFASAFASGPAISRSGKRLAYAVYRKDSNIWRLELEQPGRPAAAPIQAIASTKLDEDPSFSPDGKTIAFISERSGAPELWICEHDGSNPRQLTSLQGKHGISGPQWSPDQQNIAVTVFEQIRPHVGIINARSGALRTLSIAGDGKWPSWSRDGKWLYYASYNQRKSGIGRIRPNGEDQTFIIEENEGLGYDMPQPSPDGKFIYFNTGWPGLFTVWRMTVNGEQITKIVDGVNPRAQWSAGPNGIYFYTKPDSHGRTEMQLYEYATGKTSKILTLDRGAEFRITVSPDGRTIYYPQLDEHGSDLMLVENFR